MNELGELEEMTEDLWFFIEQYSCQLLLYTGPGRTEDVIRRIEWALAFLHTDSFHWTEPAALKKRA